MSLESADTPQGLPGALLGRVVRFSEPQVIVLEANDTGPPTNRLVPEGTIALIVAERGAESFERIVRAARSQTKWVGQRKQGTP